MPAATDGVASERPSTPSGQVVRCYLQEGLTLLVIELARRLVVCRPCVQVTHLHLPDLIVRRLVRLFRGSELDKAALPSCGH